MVTVAHFQGNLFTAEAFLKLKPWMEPYFHTIAVATPASKIPNNGKGVTFYNDIINLVPYSMNNNINNPNKYDYYPVNAVGETLPLLTDQKSAQYHEFDYYLGYPVYEEALIVGSSDKTTIEQRQTNEAKDIILQWMYDEIIAHHTRDSQWKLNEKSNEGTKDYRVTLVHIKDPENIKLDFDVYPFNLDGKLYQLKNSGDYVKASFGGEEILEIWEGQDEETQFYKLEGTVPPEYIEGEKEDICKSMPYKADHFIVEWNFAIEDGNRKYVYYANNPQEMGAKLAFRVSAIDNDGYIFTDLDNGCYPDDLNVTLTFDIEGEKNLKSNIQYKDDNSSLTQLNTLKEKSNLYSFSIKTSDFVNGSVIKEIKINFGRATNITKQPMKMTITDINASLGTIFGNDSIDKSVTFVYAAAYVPSINLTGYSKASINVSYEIYCDTYAVEECIIPFGRESEDHVRWFIAEGDSNFDFSNPRARSSGLVVEKLSNNTILAILEDNPYGNKIYYTPKDYLLYDKYNPNIQEHSFIIKF